MIGDILGQSTGSHGSDPSVEDYARFEFLNGFLIPATDREQKFRRNPEEKSGIIFFPPTLNFLIPCDTKPGTRLNLE